MPNGLPKHDKSQIDSEGYIEPQDLDSPEDFIKYWEPQWAKSLVMYHPEYCYYQWCSQNSELYQFEEDLLVINTFEEAEAAGYVRTSSSDIVLFDVDPFFEDNHIWLDLFYQAGLPERMNKIAKKSVYCATYEAETAEENQCLEKDHVNFGEGDTVTQNNQEWIGLRAAYLFYRNGAINQERTNYVAESDNCFENTGIGFGRELDGVWNIDGEYPYKDKDKRFVELDDWSKLIGGSSNPKIEQQKNAAEDIIRALCNKCPIAIQFEALIEKLIDEKKIDQFTDITSYFSIAPTVFEAWGLGYTNYQWEAQPFSLGAEGSLGCTITGDGNQLCQIIITPYENQTTIDWSAVKSISNVTVSNANQIPNGGYFTMTLNIESDDGTISEIEAYGGSDCIQLDDCNIRNTSDGDQNINWCAESYGLDLLRFTKYLFQDNRFLDSDIVLLKDGKRVPAYSEKLTGNNFDNNADHRWFYDANGTSEAFAGTIIRKGEGSGDFLDARCSFAFYLEEDSPGEITDNITIQSIELPANHTGSTGTNYFVLIGVNKYRERVKIRAYNSCYQLLPGCPTTDICGIEPTGTLVPSTPCEQELEEAIASQAEMHWDIEIRKLRASVREDYVKQCLSAAEQFTADYNDNLYHYTLFYYNQANQLVRTIPPSGVNPIDLDQMHSGNVTNREQIKKYRSKEVGAIPVFSENKLHTTYAYNTINNVVKNDNPDAKTTQFWYDRLGRIVASQDAQQDMNDRYNYILYDELGRVYESGEIENYGPLTTAIAIDDYQFDYWLNIRQLGARKQIVRTFYDRPLNETVSDFFGAEGQKFLRKRIATVAYYGNGTQTLGGYNAATHYSYDAHGNVSKLIQENPTLATLGQSRKTITYDYDLISGNVNQVNYQPGAPDQFYHRYEYDEDNRLSEVYTSKDATTWEKDATYSYYDHGPLSRLELGEGIQGIDYTYTLQGWLKGVNSSTVELARDPGKDGISGGVNAGFASDVFGYSLSYNSTDYSSIGTVNNPFLEPEGIRDLYNGNITAMTTGISEFMQNGQGALGKLYTYDQLNRLVSSSSASVSAIGSTTLNAYRTAIDYDPNGNILSMRRAGTDENINASLMDNLIYRYNTDAQGNIINNQLKAVTEQVAGEDLGDIRPGQTYGNTGVSNDNYQYNEKGQLIADRQEGITLIEWNVFDKVSRVVNGNGTTITFEYDPLGNRIRKAVTNNVETRVTHYVRDAMGKTMAVYEQVGSDYRLIEQPIYGADRLGQRTDVIDLR